jgi:hypothetical protein
MIENSAAKDYYIAPYGNDKNLGTYNYPWRTITKANLQLQPGDVVYIRQGYYRETIEPAQSGTDGLPIIYSGYQNETAVIHSRPTGVYLSGKKFIIIQKLHFENCNYFIRSYPNGFDFCEIKDCVMKNQSGWCGVEIGDGCSHNKVVNNIIASGEIEGDCLHIGKDDFGEEWGAQFNMVEGNECSGALHGGICCTGDKTRFNIIRNNYVHHIGDNAIATGAKAEWTIIEGNRIYNPGTDRDGASAMQIRTENTIIRFNVMYRDINQDIDNGAAALVLQSTNEFPFVRNNKIYHNVIYNFGQANTQWHGIQLAAFNTETEFGPNTFKNNIIYKNGMGAQEGYQVAFTRSVKSMPVDFFEGNLICKDKANDPVIYFFEFNRATLSLKQAKQSYPAIFQTTNIDVSPKFADEINYNFHLQTSSPCIDAGSFLTRTLNSGTGKEIRLEDASYFCDGWNISKGDVIKIGSADPMTIVKVNYSTHVVTIAQSITWQIDDPVSLHYVGTAPDIGAFEFATQRNASAPIPPQNVKLQLP